MKEQIHVEYDRLESLASQASKVSDRLDNEVRHLRLASSILQDMADDNFIRGQLNLLKKETSHSKSLVDSLDRFSAMVRKVSYKFEMDDRNLMKGKKFAGNDGLPDGIHGGFDGGIPDPFHGKDRHRYHRHSRFSGLILHVVHVVVVIEIRPIMPCICPSPLPPEPNPQYTDVVDPGFDDTNVPNPQNDDVVLPFDQDCPPNPPVEDYEPETPPQPVPVPTAEDECPPAPVIEPEDFAPGMAGAIAGTGILNEISGGNAGDVEATEFDSPAEDHTPAGAGETTETVEPNAGYVDLNQGRPPIDFDPPVEDCNPAPVIEPEDYAPAPGRLDDFTGFVAAAGVVSSTTTTTTTTATTVAEGVTHTVTSTTTTSTTTAAGIVITGGLNNRIVPAIANHTTVGVRSRTTLPEWLNVAFQIELGQMR